MHKSKIRANKWQTGENTDPNNSRKLRLGRWDKGGRY